MNLYNHHHHLRAFLSRLVTLFYHFLLFCLAYFSTPTIFAQQNFVMTDRYQAYYDARQLFAEGNFALSYPVFKETEKYLQQSGVGYRQIQQDEIKFYTTACELLQGNIAAERNAEAFLAGNNSEVLKGQMAFYLGRYFFKKNDYEKAMTAYAKASTDNLGKVQALQMQFEQGYALITQKKLKEAKPLMNAVRLEASSEYYAAANYYYGLISYNEGKFKEALLSFNIAGNDPAYQSVAPYYSASIQYALGNKDKGLELALNALNSGNQVYTAELNQLIGHAYFEKGDFNKALPYLEKYVSNTPKVKREDLYELAFCYYQKPDYAKAINGFKPLSNENDSLSQHAMYLLADAYLKTGDKPNAKTAFTYSASNSSIALIKENSIFHAGKLAYDLGLDGEATLTLKDYVTKYPTGKYATEARDLLVNALSNTSNYKEALTLYESLSTKSAASQKLYPRLLYNRAQELLNDKNPDQAALLLQKALTISNNAEVLPLINFWLGEIAFANKKYTESVKYMNDYLRKPVTNGEANTSNASYTLAYSYLLLEDYVAAQKEWEALRNANFATVQQQDDVKMRLADAYYMQKKFNSAKPLYSAAIDSRSDYADYALYQSGLIAGAENKPAQKINFLQTLDRQYPASVLTPIANLEIAKAFMADEKYKDALPWLAKIVSSRAGEGLKPEALLKQGLAFYNLNDNTQALNSFKTLLTNYGDSPEADEAIDNVRSIFIEQGKPNEFIVFMNNAGRKLDGNVADSLTYVAAELQLSEGKKEAALAGFTDYLKRFPEGRFTLSAKWSSAELMREKKDMKGAIPLYEQVVKLAPNKFAEASLLYLSRHYYFDLKEYKQASAYYKQLKEVASTQENRLEAMRGLVRCQYYSGDYADATTNANELMEQKGIGADDKIFANLVLGKNAQQQNNYAEAIGFYEIVGNLSKAEYGAEARYAKAYCLFMQAKYDAAEAAAFDMIKKSGSYAEWVTRSYILLGDIYFKQKDYFNAKATFKSVSENASIAALKTEATKKLAQVEKEESESSKIGQ